MYGARQDKGRKIVMKRLVRGEKGYILIAALLVLVVVGLISGPVLSYMVSGLRAGHVFETGAAELYAADAGVQDAVWRIQEGKTPLCTANPGPWCYEISDVNGRRVRICIEYGETWKITSTAITDTGDGVAALPSSTAVEAYLDVQYMDFSSLLDNALVSENSITIKNDVSVTGNVTSGGSVEIKDEGDVDGTVTEGADLGWPSAEDLSAYYLNQVDDGVHYGADTLLDLEGDSCPPWPIYKTIDKTREAVSWPGGLGPLYVDGTLDITSSDQDNVVTLTLSDTVYITGDTKIYGPNANTPLNINLNGQTIFVESNTSGGKYALEVKNCVIDGPGCIIAVGDVYLDPGSDVGSEDGFVLVMSIEGTTTLRPSGTFYGCIAGNLAVDVQSGNNATIVNTGLGDEGDLNFPAGIGDDPNALPPVTSLSIESWEISRQ